MQESIEDLKSTLLANLDQLTDLYPDRRKPTAIKLVIDNAKRLYSKTKTDKEALQAVNAEMSKQITKKEQDIKQAKEEALQQAEEKAKRKKDVLEQAKSGNLNKSELFKLANLPPDHSTGTNVFRPEWVQYNSDKNIWQLDSNLLARTIISENHIIRMQENGEVSGYWLYDDSKGSWRPISLDDINNIINLYFEFPDDPSTRSQAQYALDQQTAKNQRDTLNLVLSKINGANQSQTIDHPPHYLIHFKDFDFDLKNWKKQEFKPDNYFISNRDYNLVIDGTTPQIDKILTDKSIFSERKRTLIDSLAPETTDWLLNSLGDEETLKSFLELLGLSFLNFQPENFIVFMRSGGGTGKSRLFEYISSLFGKDNDVISLDFEHIIEPKSFDVSEFRNKSINLTSDIKATYIPSSAVAIIKALSSDDQRNLPQKFSKTARFTNRANLWFNCNNLPRLSSDSYDNSIARRFFIFDWLFIKGINWDELSKVLKKERGELVFKALYFAKLALDSEPKKYEYLDTPSKITRSKRIIDNYLEYKNEYNLLDRFIKEECSIGPIFKIGVTFLRQEYSRYLLDNGHKQDISIETFEKQLSEQYHITKSKNVTSWKKGTEWYRGTYVFLGITLNEYAGTQKEEEEFNEERRQRRLSSPYLPESQKL